MIALLATTGTEGYGWALLQAMFAVAGVCLLAWVALRGLSKLGVGNRRADSPLRIVDRLPFDARRSVYLVRAGDRYFLIGVGEGAAPNLISEVQGNFDNATETMVAPKQSFQKLIDGLRNKRVDDQG